MEPRIAIIGVWLLWGLSWLAASFWSARTEARPPLHRMFLDRALTILGIALLFGLNVPDAWWQQVGSLWPVSTTAGWLLVMASAAGFLFCWWARIHLGRMWSSSVTRKVNHHIVDTGPYRFVRHPIYTGIIIASFATAADFASLRSFAGAAIMTLGWYVKARVEESFLREQLGAQAYDAYARKTAMLVPFVKI